MVCCFLFKQKTAYEMRISDWSSDVCSSDLLPARQHPAGRLAGNLRAPLRRRAIDTRRRRSPDHEEPTAHAGRTAAHRSAARVAHFEGEQALIAIDLSGKVDVVTGGSRGLGRDIPRGLSRAGERKGVV